MIIGLTGGIGSGKSAAGNIFRQYGITVIDADQASREVFEKDPSANSDAIDLLGEEVVQSDGSLSREKIRDLVFNDYDLKSNLEKIEGIELMRALENDMKIGTFNLEGKSFSVDTSRDFYRAQKFMINDKFRKLY